MAMVAGAPLERARRIAIGQVVGFALLVVVAAAAAALLFEFSTAVVGLLGLVPLAIGVRGLVLLARHRDGETEDAPSGASTRTRTRRRFRPSNGPSAGASRRRRSSPLRRAATTWPSTSRCSGWGGRRTSASSRRSSWWVRSWSPGSFWPAVAIPKPGAPCCASATWPSRSSSAVSVFWSWCRRGPSRCSEPARQWRGDGPRRRADPGPARVGRPAPRPYDEVMEAWRTSCPRLPVWEEANERGFLARSSVPGQGALITVTPAGASHLRRHRASTTV